jgi:hypothetical protein
LKSICLRERYPDASVAADFRKFDAINELKFIGAFDDARFTGSMNGGTARIVNWPSLD